MKQLIKFLTLFILGGCTYVGLELLWRGHSHWTMLLVGGLCFLFVGGVNNYISWEMPFWKQCVLGGIGCTIIEFISGIILNIVLKLNIWDYSNLPLNIFGQICLPFTILWMILSGVAIIYDDYVRYIFFGEEKPHYC